MDKNLSSGQSLRFSVISKLFALIIFLLLILGGYQYKKIEEQANHRYQSDKQIAISYFSSALKQAIWEFDEPLIDELVQAQSSIDSLLGLTVPGIQPQQKPVYLRNEKGELFRSESGEISRENIDKKVLNLTHNDRDIGTIELYFDDEYYPTQIRNEFAQLLIQISLLALILLVVFYNFVNGYVVKPISRLYNSVENMSEWHDASSDLRKELPNNEIRALAEKYADVYRELNSHKQHLEELVAKRTNSLKETNDKLVEEISIRKESEQAMALAKQVAQDADSAKSRFLSHITHELRTPLNGILGYAQILGDKQLPEKEKEYTSHILRCSLHLLELINNILDYNKLETVSVESNPKPHSLLQLVDEIKTIVYPRCFSKNLSFEIQVPENLPPLVDVDAGKLKQVLVNLLANAIKFTESGFVRLIINNSKAEQYYFSVKDSGPGIQESERKRIFEAYVQSSNIEMTDASTGLGLSISKSLVESLGGELILNSELGAGSEFYFEVKLPLSANQEKRAKGEIVSFEESRNILIVDDNRDNLFILRKVLEKVGFEVASALSANEAFSELEKMKPDMIFMDVHMPEMDGIKAAKIIRSQHPSITIVAFTANIYDESKTNSGMDCFDGFVYKPVNRQAIYRLIAKKLRVNPIYQQP